MTAFMKSATTSVCLQSAWLTMVVKETKAQKTIHVCLLNNNQNVK